MDRRYSTLQGFESIRKLPLAVAFSQVFFSQLHTSIPLAQLLDWTVSHNSLVQFAPESELFEACQTQLIQFRFQRKVFAKAKVMEAALLMFALSVVSWLLDNYHCSRLRHLPGGIPYPHLHTWWHVFIAGTLHCIMILLHMDTHRHSVHLHLRFLAGLPVIRA